MKPKQIIKYSKNKKEVITSFNLFTRFKIILDLFDHPYSQENNFDFYKINDDIEYLHLKNIVFDRNLRFIIPKETILILEDCKFKGNNLNFSGGSVELIRPDLPCQYWRNNIRAQQMEDFSITLRRDSIAPLNLSVESPKIFIQGGESLQFLNLEGKEISLENISKVKSFSIQGETIKIKNSSVAIDECIDYQGKIEDSSKSIPYITSKILELENTQLSSYRSLNLKIEKIILDSNSSFSSNHNVVIGNHTYKNKKAPKAIMIIKSNYLKQEPKTMQSQRKLISILKAVKEVAEQEIKLQSMLKEETLEENFSSLQGRKSKIKEKVKRYEQGTRIHKTLGQYDSFYK